MNMLANRMVGLRALAVIWRTLTSAQRRRFVLLQFVSILMAVSTVVSLAAIMAFLALIANPALIDTHVALRALWQILQTSQPHFLMILAAAFIALLCLSALLNVLGSRAAARFAYSVGDRVREVLFAGYLRRDYLFHARAGAARLMENVLYQADRVITTLLNGQLLMTNAVLTVLVVVSIAIVSPTVAFAGVLVFAGSYLLFYHVIRRRVGRNGRQQTQFGVERIAVVEQAFRGIKYLLIARAQNSFSMRLGAATRALSHSLADTQFVGQFPKYVLECAAGAALIACAAYAGSGPTGGVWLAQLSFIGFAGFRLLPALQQMYYAFVTVRANRSSIENLAAELGSAPVAGAGVPVALPEMPVLSQSLELLDVSFRYSPAAPLVLDCASLRIPAGAAIGIVGVSGCGKTTLVDILLGLLSPGSGRVEIDGAPLDPSRVAAWQQAIGYVPQGVMILDASVRENIAFGVEPGEIDDVRVRAVACQAGAHEFIETLPGGYAARITGTGWGLSGGQLQRIGIARALYNQPSLLVLDEATNSLDADTERAIIETVVRNRGSRTLVIVAHGAAVIDACDRVYELRGGVLRARGEPAGIPTPVRRVAE